ncbi:MAG: phosphoribosylglycinamide synthetase C domain-containing protein, partial [Chthoniobacterales bacterium]
MLTAEGPKVLEFNARFGDPETQVLLPRLRSDLVDLLEATIDGRLDSVRADWDPRAACCVVMTSGGYPGEHQTGFPIEGLDVPDALIFHAGTKTEGDKVVTSGGRVLGVTALGETPASAIASAYDAVGRIRFENAAWRTDIGAPDPA